ncbi:response regulator with CheY-like receiver, AAA-type ATPase, and DNA-binding domains [Rivularia sp. PCC 7116]|uniref:response regulator n=1 Tax=Rivularia sp. PCC 7116 TaxID=373994 RepID=UPI00029ED391|nr:response regulator [Rivularia sp. PCC 7116]AFY54525.1 response regulator with CheY-like receiver, AAA-type ATPase, and DNA-binding domains [Rivularia sp. PCC 7116]
MIIALVVDDEPDVQLLFKQKFRKEIKAGEVKLYFALSGEEALQTLQSEDMASLVLILSDINMPGMNGLELLKIIKDKYAHLKVFMITAYGDEKNHQTAISYGADDYISKPIDFKDLKTRIFSLER